MPRQYHHTLAVLGRAFMHTHPASDTVHHTQIKHGETFVSETDTEVVPKLCKFVYNRLGEKVPFPKVSC